MQTPDKSIIETIDSVAGVEPVLPLVSEFDRISSVAHYICDPGTHDPDISCPYCETGAYKQVSDEDK